MLSRTLRQLLLVLITANRPLVVHNGLLDLMFFHHVFHVPLPKKIGTFVRHLVEMFPGAVWDTKYAAEYVFRDAVTFLAMLFRKGERAQERRQNAPTQLSYIKCIIQLLVQKEKPLEQTPIISSSTEFCEDYAVRCKVRLG
jgi:target of EGR1 protein 1